MFELPGIFSFDSRINFLDSLLNKITENTEYKFYILCIIHYFLALIGVSIIIFSENIYLLYISIFLIILIFIFNYIDNGCILMKLERKYIGKEWLGILTGLNYIYPNLINKENNTFVFMIFMILILFYSLYKLKKINEKSEKSEKNTTS